MQKNENVLKTHNARRGEWVSFIPKHLPCKAKKIIILFHWNVLLPLEMNILNKKNRITKNISSLIYDIGGVSNKTTFSHISPKMPVCVDKNQQSGGVCYNGECVHQYFTAFFMYFRGKKRHFKIKCNRSPLFFFMSP